MKMVPEEKVLLSHNLTELPSPSCTRLEVLLDSARNFYPLSWSQRGQSGGSLIPRHLTYQGHLASARKIKEKRLRRHKSL